MIIQCEQCRTRFRLDDAKVTEKGVKVRCAKCRHVFSVTREQAAESQQSDFGELLDRSSSQSSLVAPPSPPDQASAPSPPQEKEPEDPFGFELPPGGFSFGDSEPPALQQEMRFDLGEESGFGEQPPQQPTQSAATDAASTADAFDFSAIDFGESPAPVPPAGHQQSQVSPDAPGSASEPRDELEFPTEALFGEAPAPQAEEGAKDITFDFGDEFAESLGTSSSPGTAEKTEKPRGEEPLSLGDIDFGDELSSIAVQQVNPDELKPAQSLLFTPAEQPNATAAGAVTSAPPAQEPAQEVPPLPIASRRKQSPLLTALVSLLGIVAVAAIAFYGYTTFFSGAAGKPETGRITVRGVDAGYVHNKSAGDLLVINGEAVNEFKAPRAAIQVKGLVYGPAGQVLASKSAYGGNVLSREQLADMPLDKIEAAMANQFGDSLANLEVPPGKAIPFVIVIPHPPAGAKDYGVEPTGSTVATSKH